MPKRPAAQRFLLLLFFVFLLAVFVDSALLPASAQEASSTPEELTPAGTPSSIPELPTVGPVNVSYPIHGQTLKAIVNITGAIALEGWSSYDLAFSYADSADPNWFIFSTATNPIPDGAPLAAWDTTTLTDGVYNLRLRVFTPDGASQDVFIYGLRVQNYIVDTPVATLTFTPTLTPLAPPSATPTLTFTPPPSSTPYSAFASTPLPPNPAILPTNEIIFNLARGALFTVMLFGVFGLFLRMRAKRK